MSDEIYGILEGLTREQWDVKVDTNWTVKDVLAHLVGWEKECAKQVPLIWQNKEKPWFTKTEDYADFNQKSIEEYKGFSPRQLLNEWYSWQTKLEKEVAKIGEDKMKHYPELFNWYFEETDPNQVKFTEIGMDHYTEHLNQIKKTLKIRES